jgi:uncharacterized protein YdaU (DUF1376 family)
MHYYQFNIGDYASHTRHLDLLEDLAYRRLLDLYYLHERPLSVDATTVAKQIGMRDHAALVRDVLNEFFELNDEGYKSARADREIEHFRSKIEQASRAGKASAERRSNARSTDVQPTNNQEPITNNQVIEGTNVPSCPPNGERKALPECDHQEVIRLYHEVCPTLPRVEVWNDTRAGYLRQRWREVATDLAKQGKVSKNALIEWWKDFFQFVSMSDFLMGRVPNRTGKPFLADLEWLIKPTNFAKVIENRYHRK